MNIFALPTELQLSVCELLDPFSCFDYATSCKTIWALSEPLIKEHKRHFQDYKSLESPNEEYSIWKKTEELLSDSRIGDYVRDLSFRGSRCYWDQRVWSQYQIKPDMARPPQALCERLLVAMTGIQDIYAPDPSSAVEDAIRDGSEEPLVAILAHSAPNLRSFRYTTGGDSKFNMFHMLVAITTAYGGCGPVSQLPFQHLTTVVVAHWDTEGVCDARWCALFTAIPSVRNFVGMQMGGYWLEKMPQHLCKSQVKDLLFLFSAIDPQPLENILKNIEALERFSYEDGGELIGEINCHPEALMRLLATYAGRSLKHLTLETDWEAYEDHCMDREMNHLSDLTDFKSLKTLRCDWKMLKRTTGGDSDSDRDSDVDELPDGGFYTEEPKPSGEWDPRPLLPQSLETLHVQGHFDGDDGDWETVVELFKKPSEHAPNLKHVYIEKELSPTRHFWHTEGTKRLPRCNKTPLAKYTTGHGQQ